MYISEKVLVSLSVTVDVFDTLSVTLPFEFCDDPVEISGCVMVDVGVCVRACLCVLFLFVYVCVWWCHSAKSTTEQPKGH